MTRVGWKVAAAAALIGGLAGGLTARGDEDREAALRHFEEKVRPVLADRCLSCHGPDKQQAGLRLDSRAAMIQGGDTGGVIEPGRPTDSPIVAAIRQTGEVPKMPPKGDRLADDQVAAIEGWIAAGAPWPEGPKAAVSKADAIASQAATHWAFRPIADPPVPVVADAAWNAEPLDSYIRDRLDRAGIAPSEPADPTTWLRRVTFDLIGLPPTPEELTEFLADPGDDARAEVVDRLLASPRYGERWGRHWLDVARYADTKGYVFQEERRYPYSYTYRDWVIRAFNDDIPYDTFLTRQLAADLMPDKDDDPGQLAALGFLTVGRRYLNVQDDIYDDRIDVTTRGLMGLTVSCARCHDHKYDPIPAADYYALYGVFASSEEPKELPLIGGPDAGSDAYKNQRAERQSAIDAFLAKLQESAKKELTDRADAYFKAAQDLGPDPRNPKLDERAKADDLRAELLRVVVTRKPQTAADVPALADGDPKRLLRRDDRNKLRELEKKVAELDVSHPDAPPRAMVMNDKATPYEPYVFLRGNAGKRGPSVPRRFLTVLAGPEPKPFTQGSGRLELARAIVDPANPLTARVIVNRVWMYHFGRGLVATPSDFGLRSDPPSHPELLDHLATSLMKGGWSLKALHRRIVLSRTYAQASLDRPEARAKDPENDLLWRQNRQRLELEPLRDSLLAASGRLDLTMGGRSVSIVDAPYSTRRTVYAYIDRQNLDGVFRTFDLASPDASSPRRFVTTIPQQALYLMNHPFVAEQARALADRAAKEAGEATEGRVRRLHQLALSRDARPWEIDLAARFLSDAEGQGTPSEPAGWRYGYGGYDDSTDRVKEFTPLAVFTGKIWQAGPKLPEDGTPRGYLSLSAEGGHVGRDADHAAIRRWIAPGDGTIGVEGRLSHAAKAGDGVRARVVAARSGRAGEWVAHGEKVDTKVESIAVTAGEAVDFVVDCRDNDNSDSFGWAPSVRFTPKSGGGGLSFRARDEFGGPPPPPLDAWARYAQALLMSNEFTFFD
jgi:mono/diheme cytochrome c family protein